MLGALGLSAVVAPDDLVLGSAMLSFDIPVMVAVCIACLPIFATGNLIARWEGGLFFAYYCAYTLYLILAAKDHDNLADYAFVMQTIALPLTAVTLIVISVRHWQSRRS